MRKLSLLLILLMLFLVGCGGKTEETNSPQQSVPQTNAPQTNDPQTKAPEAKGYVFETKGTAIAMHEVIAPILSSLGQHKEYFEAASCAFPGLEKTYTYGGFEVNTYESKEGDRVAAVIFLDDSVATKEGIAIGDNLDKVLKAYGDKYTKTLDLYTYEKDKTKLAILMENGAVASIEYTAVPDEHK